MHMQSKMLPRPWQDLFETWDPAAKQPNFHLEAIGQEVLAPGRDVGAGMELALQTQTHG